MANWGAEETARIRGWEEREVKHIQGVANETAQLVQEVCAHRIKVGASVLTQRMGLRASLEEFEQALADLPSDPAARLSKMQAVYAERKRLCELLAESTIDVPSAQEILRWAELPALAAVFDPDGAGNGGLQANAVSDAAKARLGRARDRTPALASNVGFPEFPVIPKLVRCRCRPRRLRVCYESLLLRAVLVSRRSYPLTHIFTPSAPSSPACFTPIHRMQDANKPLRSISMGSNKPSVFVGLDDGTAVVGFQDESPLQVWDLAAGKLVREFKGNGRACHAMINLPGRRRRVAAGWHISRPGSVFGDSVVTLFNAATGKQLQVLTGFFDTIYGMALVDDHLLVMSKDEALRVWTQDEAGKVRH